MKEYKNIIAAVIVALIIGGAIILAQANKADSIERQQKLELQAEMVIQAEKNCQNKLKGLQNTWNNVVGIGYSSIWDECEVTYVDPETTNIETAPLSSMADHEK